MNKLKSFFIFKDSLLKCKINDNKIEHNLLILKLLNGL
jgi:hypothetical protein